MTIITVKGPFINLPNKSISPNKVVLVHETETANSQNPNVPAGATCTDSKYVFSPMNYSEAICGLKDAVFIAPATYTITIYVGRTSEIASQGKLLSRKVCSGGITE